MIKDLNIVDIGNRHRQQNNESSNQSYDVSSILYPRALIGQVIIPCSLCLLLIIFNIQTAILCTEKPERGHAGIFLVGCVQNVYFAIVENFLRTDWIMLRSRGMVLS